ncbi:MAG: hypothetical protein H6739_37980 [Alphaproteobacteria bacterium]|nr:hypothetical protein [Alphaproteobacteria bacterium]
MGKASSSSALKDAMQGTTMSERRTKSALGEAVSRIASLTRRTDKQQEALLNTATEVVHTAETQGSLFLSSLAEGYLGPDKLKLGGVDVRAVSGVAAKGYGLYQLVTGQAGGTHALALGKGVFGSWLASVARNAGETLARQRKGAAPEPASVATVTVTPVMQGAPQTLYLPQPQLTPAPSVAGPPREVLLTPATEGEDRPGRFPRARDASDT